MTTNTLESLLRRALRFAVGFLILSAVSLNFANVVGRYVFLKPFVWAEEVMQFMSVWAVMLGAAVVTSHRTHLRMDAFYNLAPPTLRRALDVFGNLLAVAVALYVIYQSLQMIQMLATTGQKSVIARFPMDAMYGAIPLGFGCGLLFLVLAIGRLARRDPLADRPGVAEAPELMR